jgi:hypothetical protein
VEQAVAADLAERADQADRADRPGGRVPRSTSEIGAAITARITG